MHISRPKLSDSTFQAAELLILHKPVGARDMLKAAVRLCGGSSFLWPNFHIVMDSMFIFFSKGIFVLVPWWFLVSVALAGFWWLLTLVAFGFCGFWVLVALSGFCWLLDGGCWIFVVKLVNQQTH